MKTSDIKVLLIDDQITIVEAIRHMLEDQSDIVFEYCQNPADALQTAKKFQPSIILQDLVMPEMNGLVLLRYFKANPATKEIPVIVLSAAEEVQTKAEAFSLGANDYLVKLPDKIELVARIRHHSAAYIHLLERNEAYKKLDDELLEAATYVKSLLPAPFEDKFIKTSWKFIPSTQLGGDAFGYHWLDSTHFAVYLFDVCGHGVGAALLSISILNVLHTQALVGVNYFDPKSVLTALNQTFPMEDNSDRFFTMWYGVYDTTKREIIYADGGHPPAILFTGPSAEKALPYQLKTHGMAVGACNNSPFDNATCPVDKYGKLYVYSDGLDEISKPDGSFISIDDMIQVLGKQLQGHEDALSNIVKYGVDHNKGRPFLDDFAIAEICLK